MSYSPIAPDYADPLNASYQDLAKGKTPSLPRADLPYARLSSSFNDLPGEEFADDSNIQGAHDVSKVSKLLSSLTSSTRQSYDLVEADDYEVIDQTTPTIERHLNPIMTTVTEPQLAESSREDLPIRTASISRHLPLNHPTPDLQSLQGAYVKNVERLEESAERLSIRSSLDDELHRINYEQRHGGRTASGSSHANSVRPGSQRRVSTRSSVDMNSIVGSVGQFSHAYMTSPVSSIKSPRSNGTVSKKRMSRGSRLSQAMPEPELEGRPLDSDLTFSTPQRSLSGTSEFEPNPVRSLSNVSRAERPTTSGSGDTYQQADTLFTDFDGVHFAPERTTRKSRRISLNRPPRARDSRAFKEPQPGEEMIYYPAPVPVMLNLPTRLSKMNWSDQEKKRLQALSNIPDDMRKSAAWLANEEGVPNAVSRHSKLPPQLRASAFFDHRAVTQDVELKNGSAVATLDSILDAAAHAPVSAFTDHPIAGHLGSDIYSPERISRKSVQIASDPKAKRKSSFSNLLRRKSSGNLSEAMARESRIPSMMLRSDDGSESGDDHIEGDAERSIAPDADEMPEQDQEHDEADGSDAESTLSDSHLRPGFLAAPTTLLAELQMRKAQQKMRNRTAVDAFPNGMHSTLLELDTIAQLQQKARRQKHVKLAWEDKEVVDKENFDDDEVPLAVLFPEKDQHNLINLTRPLGLMEKKELEENEPLSQRRARLRGEPIQPPAPARSPAVSQGVEDISKPMLDLPKIENSEDEREGETLAQRRQRMKNRSENGPSEFAQQVSTELGLSVAPSVVTPSESRTPDVEETLGQRRKRLQAEALLNNGRNISGGSQEARPVLRTQRSLADVLQANPVGYVDPNAIRTAQLAIQNQERARDREAKFYAAQEAERKRIHASQSKFGLGNESGLIQGPNQLYQGYQFPHLQPQPHPGTTAPYLPSGQAMNVYQNNYGYPSMPQLGMQPAYSNPVTSMAHLQMNYPYQYPVPQDYGYQSAVDLTGMGPPLNSKQRARIEGWRQSIV